MLKWLVVEKDDKQDATGKEGLSVRLLDNDGCECDYTVDQATFDGLRVSKSYGLSLTPIEDVIPIAVDPAAAKPTESASTADPASSPAGSPTATDAAATGEASTVAAGTSSGQ